jgi:hypothetical protein
MLESLARRLGPIAAALALAGCEVAPHGAATEDEARRQFAEAAYCPLDRVEAERVDGMAPAPPGIAKDPERMAMWRRSFQVRTDPRARQTIAVSGCGEHDTYACWDWVGDVPGRHGKRRRVYIGTSCNEASR